MKRVTESTTISIGLGVIILGGVVWATRYAFTIDAMAQNLQDVKQGQTEYTKNLEQINTRLTIIETKQSQIELHLKKMRYDE